MCDSVDLLDRCGLSSVASKARKLATLALRWVSLGIIMLERVGSVPLWFERVGLEWFGLDRSYEDHKANDEVEENHFLYWRPSLVSTQ